MGLGLLGTAIAGGFKGAGEIADDELKNRAAASLAAQRDAAAAQREERLNELRKEMANNQLQAQQGQWDVQNKKTDAELQLREQANQNTSEYQKGLLKLREQEVGKQSAQEQELGLRRDLVDQYSNETDPAKKQAIVDKYKMLFGSDKSEGAKIKKTVKSQDGSSMTVEGAPDVVNSLMPNAGGGLTLEEAAKNGGVNSLDPRKTAEALAQKRREDELAARATQEQAAARVKALAAGDPNYQAALDRISAGNQEKENQGLLKQASQKQARIQALESQRANVLKYAQELDKTNPKAALTYWQSYRNFSDEIDRLNSASQE